MVGCGHEVTRNLYTQRPPSEGRKLVAVARLCEACGAVQNESGAWGPARSRRGSFASSRSRDDGGAAEVVGVVLCVGLTLVVFVSLFWVGGWCAGLCESHAEGAFHGSPWTYCRGHEFEKPACDQGAPVFSDVGAETVWCHGQEARSVTRAGSLVPVRVVVCVSVSKGLSS